MTYLYIALVAQILNALVVLLDKYLIASKSVSRPMVYAFYISALSSVTILLLLLGQTFGVIGGEYFGKILLPTMNVVRLSLAVAATQITSILFLYKSLTRSDASDVAPVLGAVAASSSLFFGFLILGDRLKDHFLTGFLLLVIGMALMSYFRFSWRSLFNVLISGIFLGVSSVLAKTLFLETNFIDGFFWSRIGTVLIALFFLISASNRKAILENFVASSFRVKYLVLGNRILAGLAFLLVFYAINLGNVSIVNAISGIQFAILFVFALIFTKKFPNYFYESVNKKVTIAQKVLATTLIMAGYAVLFL